MAQFPDYLIPKLQKLGVSKHFFKKPYGTSGSNVLQGVIIAELARGDGGLAAMWTVQLGLLGYTLELLGSEEQKKKYLAKVINLELIGGWGLTEDKIGSDAANLNTTITKVSEGYKINGVKRWIGNGNKDLLVAWGKNTETKKVEAFILETKGLKGWSAEVIKNKLALRIVQNCEITLNDVVVGEAQKLPLATDFHNGTNKVLKHTRISVCWIVAGLCMGSYDHAIKYSTDRKQFGRSISGTSASTQDFSSSRRSWSG
jgi:acyl-CoA oxidase